MRIVQVKILKLDRAKEKVSLGYKQLLPDPWSIVSKNFIRWSTQITGKVSSVTDYGAFIELEAGCRRSWFTFRKCPGQNARNIRKIWLIRGDEVEVQVLGIDTGRPPHQFGMKQLQPNPWETVGGRFQVGAKVSRKSS